MILEHLPSFWLAMVPVVRDQKPRSLASSFFPEDEPRRHLGILPCGRLDGYGPPLELASLRLQPWQISRAPKVIGP